MKTEGTERDSLAESERSEKPEAARLSPSAPVGKVSTDGMFIA
jgi:hypothetical protein